MTKKIFFLQSVDSVVGKDNITDIRLSDYNFKKIKKLKLSPLRWVILEDGRLEPGHGSGRLQIGDFKFEVTYAWGGRTKPNGGTYDRTSYTTRIKGDLKELEQIVKRIISDEHDGQISKIESFRDHWANGFNIKTERDYLKFLLTQRDRYENTIIRLRETKDKESLKLLKLYKSLKSSLAPSNSQIGKAVKKWSKAWKENTMEFKIPYVMDNVETDMLEIYKKEKCSKK